MQIWKKANFEKKDKFEKLEFRKNGNLDIRKNDYWGNQNWEKCKFGKMEIWKNENLEELKFGKMETWKIENCKLGNLQK